MNNSDPFWLAGGILILILYFLISGLTEMGTKWPGHNKRKE